MPRSNLLHTKVLATTYAAPNMSRLPVWIVCFKWYLFAD